MPKKSENSSRRHPEVHPDAAGIDLGAREIYVAVGEERDERPVRKFGLFTRELRTMARWLTSCQITTVAMESTGVYWIPVAQILEEAGIEVCLVNARHVKNVPGRKTDVKDAQWLQYLHSVGLLQGSFRPQESIIAVRSLLRHRQSLIDAAAKEVQHMQKALTQMNLFVHNVLRDITGVSGMRILEAIVAGKRDAAKLAELCEVNIKANQETVIASLEGDWRAEHLFTLKQALEHYRFLQKQIVECDESIEAMLETFEVPKDSPSTPPQKKTKKKRKVKKKNKNDFAFDMRSELQRLFGVDLTAIDGISVSTAFVCFSEVGTTLDKFPTSKHFCSWLGLSPNNKITGGRVLSSSTRPGKNRLAVALKKAAFGLARSHSPMGRYYQKMRAKLGPAQAIVATAHKLARILYTMIKNQVEYDESVFKEDERKREEYRRRRIVEEARKMGLEVVPAGEVS